jgi:ABC-2 type transport system ATP-binding protein
LWRRDAEEAKREFWALRDVSFRVEAGEIVALIGRNGSGKSTLLKIISRIMEPDSGTIDVGGTIATILELGMGFHQDMTGRENIYIKGAMYGFSKKDIDERIDGIIEYSNLGDYIENPLKTYSSGMTGRLAFAIMINLDADILLVDEILSVGDVSFAAKATQHFRSVANSGKTVVFVSHNLITIEEMCSRAIWIEGGKVVEDGPAKRVCERYRREMIESFDITSELAELGVVDAQYRLARMYKEGIKVGADPATACEWMKKAADNRHIQAQVEYADMLFDGEGTEQDIVTATWYYQTAADKGNNDARMKVSALMGNEKDDDRVEILKLFKELAERGNPLSEHRYADLLFKTAWNNEDRKEALKWFLISADKGNINSKSQVAVMYRDGVGVPTDMKSSIRMFREAAASGHYWAQVSLAEMLLSGVKVDKDESEAFKWFLRSAESGNPKSQYQVATMYRDGIGTEANLEMSKMWFDMFSRSPIVEHQIMIADVLKNQRLETEHDFKDMLTKAAESHNPRAMYTLGTMYRDQIPPNIKLAVKWLTASAERNNAFAQVALGDIYLKGIGVEKDFKEALKHLMSASVNGNPLASYRVSMMYKTGTGVDKNMEKYREFLIMAVEGGNVEAIMEYATGISDKSG